MCLTEIRNLLACSNLVYPVMLGFPSSAPLIQLHLLLPKVHRHWALRLVSRKYRYVCFILRGASGKSETDGWDVASRRQEGSYRYRRTH